MYLFLITTITILIIGDNGIKDKYTEINGLLICTFHRACTPGIYLFEVECMRSFAYLGSHEGGRPKGNPTHPLVHCANL